MSEKFTYNSRGQEESDWNLSANNSHKLRSQGDEVGVSEDDEEEEPSTGAYFIVFSEEAQQIQFLLEVFSTHIVTHGEHKE